MNVRQLKLSLWSTTAGLLVGTVAVASLFWVPVESPSATLDDLRQPSGPTTAPSDRQNLPGLHEFESVWVRAHRGSLEPPAPTPPPQVRAPLQPAEPVRIEIPLKLEGWIGSAMAVVRTPDGQLWFRELGEEVNGVRLLSVAPGRVRVQYQGVEDEITKPLDPPPGQY